MYSTKPYIGANYTEILRCRHVVVTTNVVSAHFEIIHVLQDCLPWYEDSAIFNLLTVNTPVPAPSAPPPSADFRRGGF